jgi:hypothetical protein
MLAQLSNGVFEIWANDNIELCRNKQVKTESINRLKGYVPCMKIAFTACGFFAPSSVNIIWELRFQGFEGLDCALSGCDVAMFCTLLATFQSNLKMEAVSLSRTLICTY